MAVLALDVGGTFIKGTLFTPQPLPLQKVNTPMDSLERFLQTVQTFWMEHSEVEAIAISVPGIVNEESGFMETGGSLKFIRELNLAEAISARCNGALVRIVNDAKAGALAELRSGALQDVQSGIMVTLGTAVGGAVILNRTIVEGKHHFAGEFSYMLLGRSTLRGWGSFGGSNYTAELYRKRTGKAYRPEEVFDATEQDPAALEAVREYCKMLAKPLVNMQCIVDPERIVIGGGISCQPLLIKLLQEQVAKLQKETGFLDYGMPAIKIAACRYADNTYGAYYAYLDWKEKEKTTQC